MKITSPDIKSIPPEADEFENDDDEDLVINLDDLLFDMPSPDPIHIFTKSEWEAEMPESSDIVPEQVPNTQPSTMTDEKQQPDGIPELVLPWEEQGSAVLVRRNPRFVLASHLNHNLLILLKTSRKRLRRYSCKFLLPASSYQPE
jgi:hypothetical protein